MRLEQKHVDLVAGDAGVGSRLKSLTQSAVAPPSQLTETMLRIDPESQIEITASCQTSIRCWRNSLNLGISFHSAFATEPITATA
jgi:hypothetical protein